MGKDPAIQFYCNDWLSSPTVIGMEPLEELAYFRMLLFMWQSGDCSISSDPEKVSRLTRTDANTCSIVFEQAMIKHPTDSSKLTNPRLYSLWLERLDFKDKKKLAGIASGKSRREAAKSKADKDIEQTGAPVRFRSNKQGTNANSSSSSSSSSSPTVYTRDLPKVLNTDRFRGLMDRWCDYREHNAKPIDDIQFDTLKTRLVAWGHDASCDAIETAISNGWMNLRQDNGSPNGNGDGKLEPFPEWEA